jgi:uncharacterized protein YprB with RNaseH-like and TPR domain
VLRNSFILLEHIGEKTEQKFWSQGIHTWDDFLKAEDVKGISDEKKEKYDKDINKAIAAYEKKDIKYFKKVLPKKLHWRMFPDYGENTAYLDIETTGLHVYSTITVVGIYINGEMISLVQGKDLNKKSIQKALKGATMLCTFNGTLFDAPFLENHYPGCIPDIPHMDLRFVGGQAGFKGGLKSIERQLGIARPEDLVGVDGYEAVRLWKRWSRNDDADALDRLVRYNIEDVLNMKPLADILVERLSGKMKTYFSTK